MDQEHPPEGKILNRWVSEQGASLVEYALAIALIAVVSIAAITLVGEQTSDEFDCLALEFDQPDIRQRVLQKHRVGIDIVAETEVKFRDRCL